MPRSKDSALLKSHPHLKEFTAFLNELNRETERGAVLVSCALIDDLLRRIVLARLIDHKVAASLLEGAYAPLGSFATRIAAAFALGVISDHEFRECETLRKVRNIFAHRIHVSFADRKIKELCASLSMCAQDYGDVRVEARGRFTTSAVAVSLNLTNRPHYVAKKRLKYEVWRY